MAGVSIDITGMAPLTGLIGGFVGFTSVLSIIGISMDCYKVLDTGNKTFKIVHKTSTQRFIVRPEDKLEV